MRRLLGRALITIGLVLIPASLFVAPAQATPVAADFSLCKDAPPPVSPKAGMPGLLTAAPADIPASAPDPFADPKVPVGDVYGYDWHWSNYDLGCGNDFLRDPQAVTNTFTGNTLFGITDGLIASLATLEHMAKTLPIDWLSNALRSVSAALKDQVLTLWFPLATAALAVLVLWRAKKASYHETAKVAVVFLGAVGLAVFSMLYPVVMSTQIDKAVTTVADVTGSTFSTSATDSVNRQSAYRTWLAGSFGDPDGPSAKKYGPQLMAATHYTWSDWKRIETNPNAKASIDQAKAASFKQVASKLEADDPAAYETFTGRGERTGPALLGIVTSTAMGLFVGMAALMIVVARVMMQALTLIAPLAAVVGILPKHHGVLAKLWDLFTAAIVAVAKFTLAGGVMTVVLGALQGAEMSGAARLFFILVATIVGIVLTKPMRSLKTLVPGLDPNKSYLKKLVSYVGPALAAGTGSYAGVLNGVQHAEEADDRYDLDGKPVSHRFERAGADPGSSATHSLTSLPAPAWPAIGPAPAAAERQSTPFELAAAPAEMPVGLPAAQQARALPAPRLAIEATPVDQQSSTAPSTDVAPPSSPPVVPGPTVVYPDGIITQTDTAQYHPGGPVEEYVPASDLELGEDGSEHEQIVYHAAAGREG